MAANQPLAERHCSPLPEGSPALTRGECERLLGGLDPAWQLATDGKSLAREFRFRDFYRTMGFLNCLAQVAHVEDHHPDLEVSYGRIGCRFWTHTVGGLSINDFICAARVDRLPAG